MGDVSRYAAARLPTGHADFELVVFRDGAEEHVALVLGDVSGKERVLTRVHSACFTGEVLGSKRCDCREQLDAAMKRIAEEGSGVLIYLLQEGRGIGLGNKVRAYALQDQGKDTVDANLELGFEADHRSYDLAASMLADLGVRSVRLMTNNPDKIAGLAAAGIPVETHESHWVAASEQSEAYLEVKRARMGHLSDDSAPEDPSVIAATKKD